MSYHVVRSFEIGRRVKIGTLTRIFEFLRSRGDQIPLQQIEKNVIWIGSKKGPGINLPKLPFRFDTPSSTKLEAAFNSDGTIELNPAKRGHVRYYNNEVVLRKLVIECAKDVFGDIYVKEVKEKDGGHYVELAVIAGDVLKLVGISEGRKAKTNPHVPSNVLGSHRPEILQSYMQQSFDDEATVEFTPFNIRRGFTRAVTKHCSVDVTKRVRNFTTRAGTYLSFKEVPLSIKPAILVTPPNLLVDEQNLLKKFDIRARIYPKTLYCAKDGIRIIWELRITDRESLTNFWKNIGFKHPLKAAKLNEMITRSYVFPKNVYFGKRGHEKVLEKAIEASRPAGYFTITELATKINRSYEDSRYWVRKMEKLNHVRRASSTKPMKYVLIRPM